MALLVFRIIKNRRETDHRTNTDATRDTNDLREREEKALRLFPLIYLFFSYIKLNFI